MTFSNHLRQRKFMTHLRVSGRPTPHWSTHRRYAPPSGPHSPPNSKSPTRNSPSSCLLRVHGHIRLRSGQAQALQLLLRGLTSIRGGRRDRRWHRHSTIRIHPHIVHQEVSREHRRAIRCPPEGAAHREAENRAMWLV